MATLIDRKTTSVQRAISVTTSSTALLSAVGNRVAVIISAGPTNRFTLSQDATAVLDTGVTVYPATSALVLTVDDVGDVVKRAWTAISATATQTVNVIEVFALE